ncbi:MAG: site-specific DNA-methyltransferase [Rikenellaceae bacterium]
MHNLKLLEELYKLLRMESRYCSEDGVLLKNSIVESALALRPDLIKLLLSHEGIKSNFFTDVEGVMVFDKIRFQKFVMNKRFLPDSYTNFKNKIGLTGDDGDFLADSREIVLSWPYKDCVLEGGQTKEDAKRNEVFWNEILAPDEINRLTEPKALTSFARYDSDGKHEVSEITADDNLIIKGNNLLALHSLLKSYRGKVKMIYIDPPYNTGNDGFQYNDSFNHSSWLTFMRNRLTAAQELLRNDGTICISIDQNEIAYTMVVLDDIFGKENRKNIITVKRGSVTGAKVINPGVVNITEYVVIYSKSADCWKPNRVYRSKLRDDRYNSFIVNYDEGYENWKFSSLLDAFANSLQIDKKNLKKAFGNRLEEEITKFVIANCEKVIRFASLDEKSISAAACELKQKSLNNLESIFKMDREGKSSYYIHKGKLILFVKDRLLNIDGEVTFSDPIADIWDDVLPNDLHNEGSVIFRKGKKPEKLIQRILQLASSEGDIVLDYHLGSGTTAAVAHKMGRRYIGVEQMDYIETVAVERLKKVVGVKSADGMFDKVECDQGGISKAVNWKGGSSFVYCELAKANQQFAEDIIAATTKEQLKELWKTIEQTGFISYKVSPNIANEAAQSFEELSIEDLQTFLLEILDKNLLYVPLSDIDDESYNISESDKKLNEMFYSKK